MLNLNVGLGRAIRDVLLYVLVLSSFVSPAMGSSSLADGSGNMLCRSMIVPSEMMVQGPVSASWSRDGDRAWVTSARDGAVFDFRLDKGLQRMDPDSPMAISALVDADSVRSNPSGGHCFLDDNPPAKVVCVDDTGTKIEETYSVEGRDVEGGGTLLAIWDWKPWKDNIIAFADVQSGEAEAQATQLAYYSAFVLFGSGMEEEVAVISEKLKANSPLADQYAKTKGYLEVLSDSAFVLSFNQGVASLVKYAWDDVAPTDLGDLPADFRQRPDLHLLPGWVNANAEKRGARALTALYKKIERTAMGMSLHRLTSFDEMGESYERLFILSKQRQDYEVPGKTPWWFVEIDQDTGLEIERWRLPTSAAHVSISVGDDLILVVERGPVTGRSNQHSPLMDVESFVLVPVEWFRYPHQQVGRLVCDTVAF